MPTDQLVVVDSRSILAAVGDVKVARSDEAYFDLDAVGVRVTFRCGWAAMKSQRIVKLSTPTA